MYNVDKNLVQRIVDEKIDDLGHTPVDLFQRAQELQQAFWDALHDLEAVIGVDIDSTLDLSMYDLESLLKAGK